MADTFMRAGLLSKGGKCVIMSEIKSVRVVVFSELLSLAPLPEMYKAEREPATFSETRKDTSAKETCRFEQITLYI